MVEARVIDLLQKVGTQLLCMEELYHLLAGSHREQRKALNLLKFLANELKIVVVAVGTSDAFHALQKRLANGQSVRTLVDSALDREGSVSGLCRRLKPTRTFRARE